MGTSDGNDRSPNSAGGGGGSSSSKRNKPCQQCQKLKVKCERNPTGGPCQRCLASNKECTYHEPPNKKRKKDPDEYPSLFRERVNVRRLDELEKTLASMRKSLGGQASVAPPIQETFGTTGNFGHPLDMLARTAANTTSPDDRFSTPGGGGSAFNGITPPAVPMQRPMQRVIPSETVPTTWSTELSGIDPVERGWLDIDDAKMLFERYPTPLSPLPYTERHICVAQVRS